MFRCFHRCPREDRRPRQAAPGGASRFLQLACRRFFPPPAGGAEDGGRGRDGPAAAFTLIEMMVVVFIIAILAGITAVGVKSAREKARQTDCMSNLRQLGAALVTYRADNGGRNPDWLSNLYPVYIDDKRVYVCRSDSDRGHGRNRPAGVTGGDTTSRQMYDETIDNDRAAYSGTRDRRQNEAVKANSYFYEFSCADCSWRPGMTWAEAKEKQLREGDEASEEVIDGQVVRVPYSSSRMPIVRCFHHARYSQVPGYRQSGDARGSEKERSGMTINVAYAGNVFIAPIWWEGALDAGETP
jgi:prepilin-type N-terminal cleavage/methylation domain-containing protein